MCLCGQDLLPDISKCCLRSRANTLTLDFGCSFDCLLTCRLQADSHQAKQSSSVIGSCMHYEHGDICIPRQKTCRRAHIDMKAVLNLRNQARIFAEGDHVRIRVPS